MTYSSRVPDDESDEQRDPQDRPGTDTPVRNDPPAPDQDTSDPDAPYAKLFSNADVERARSGADSNDDALPDDAHNTLDDDSDVEEAPRRIPLPMIIGAVLLLAVVGVGLGLFFTQRNNQGEPDLAQEIARVGDTAITRGDFLRQHIPGQDPQETMKQLIDIELVVQSAQSEGTTIDQGRVDEQLSQLRAQHQDDAAFQEFLKSAYIESEEKLRSLIARQQLIEAMILKHTTAEQVRSRHILLTGDSPEAIEARKGEAEDLLAQIQGGADFATLAKEKSDDPGSKEQGGDLGWAPRGVFVTPFEEAIFSMKQGEVRLVQSDFGWHIIQVQDEAQVRGFENEQYLQTPAGQEAFSSTFLPWVDSLRSTAEENNRISIKVQPAELVPTEPALIIPTPEATTPQP